MSEALILYTSVGCHLCEQAAELLAAARLDEAGWQLQSVEIADSEALVARYGIRIPVVQHAASGAELNWPFDAAELEQWLVGLSIRG